MNVIGTWFEGLPWATVPTRSTRPRMPQGAKAADLRAVCTRGYSWENRHTLNPPFGPQGRISTATSASR